jgi:AraC-like DNA-binding protein
MVLGGGGAAIRLPARPDLFIEFYLGEPYRIEADGERPSPTPADVMVVAPHVMRRVTLHLSGMVQAFHISLQPTAIHRLFGMPTTHLTDNAVEGSAVLGPFYNSLRDTVLAAPDFEARARAAERWLAARLDEARAEDAVDVAARLLRRANGRLPLDLLAARTGLGERQWRRRFALEAGAPPKLYSRVARLDAALALRCAWPDLPWSELAVRGGYFDQSHLLRDARELLGASPAVWLGA